MLEQQMIAMGMQEEKTKVKEKRKQIYEKLCRISKFFWKKLAALTIY